MIMPNAPKAFILVSPPSRERCLRILALTYYFGLRAWRPEGLLLPSDAAGRLPHPGEGSVDDLDRGAERQVLLQLGHVAGVHPQAAVRDLLALDAGVLPAVHADDAPVGPVAQRGGEGREGEDHRVVRGARGVLDCPDVEGAGGGGRGGDADADREGVDELAVPVV